jgi:hypothetical protein
MSKTPDLPVPWGDFLGELDPGLLRERYAKELRSIPIGDLRQHDQTLEFWIDAYFPGSQS